MRGDLEAQSKDDCHKSIHAVKKNNVTEESEEIYWLTNIYTFMCQ